MPAGNALILAYSRLAYANWECPHLARTGNFISLLGLAQKWDVSFLPITWQPALGPLGEGASAEVYQSTIYKSLALAFKDSTAKKTGKRRTGFKDIMKEILIVRAPYIRKSPNVIDLLGITWNQDPSENQVWPVLVYRKGTYGTLRDYICNPQRMKETLLERLTLCSGVLYGLATLHSAGVVHGDLKPENIIIQMHGNYLYPAISDFGFSSISNYDDALIQIPCSPPWTAPEHHVNKHSFEKAKQMDVFSWGLILLWAILARVKLSDLSYKAQLDVLSALKSEHRLIETARSTLDQVFASPSSEPDDRELGGQLFRILERCLQHDPQLRAKTAIEVLSICPESPFDGGPLDVPAFQPQDEKDLCLPTHTSFTVQKSISQLSTIDYRVRRFILDELSRRTEYACNVCRERARYESVVALKLGFGGHFIHRIHFDNFIISATDDGTDPYCSRALQTIRDIATSSSVKLSLPTLESNSEVQNLEDLVQADLVHEYQRRQELEIAVEFYNKEIEIRGARLGEDHSLVLVLQSALLLVYEACGNSFASQEISKAIYLSLDGSLGPDHPSTLQAMAQYALQSVNAGQPSLATSLGQEFVRRGEKTFDHTDKIYITGISNLGLAYFYLELYSEAETAFETALQHHGAALGSNRMEGLKIQINLAHAIKAQGHRRIREAEQLLVEASSQLEKNLGYRHRDTISSMAARALSWYAGPGMPMPNSEVVQFHDIVTVTKEFLGSQHPDTLLIIANYAACLAHSGSWVEAKTLYEEVLEALQDAPSDTQLQHAKVMASFAVVCSEMGELDNAEELILHVLSILRGELSPLGPGSILAQHVLATLMNLYHRREDMVKAETLLMVIWESIKGGVGDALADMNVLINVRNIAVSCLDRGHRLPEARDLLLELLEIITRCNGPKHVDTIVTRNEVAESFRRQRLYSKAEKMHLETLKICQEEFDPHYRITLAVMSNLAMIYYWQLKEEQAADLMYQVYLAEAEALGPSHDDTVSSAGWVACMRRYCGADCTPDMFPGVFDLGKRIEGTDRDSIEAKLTLAAAYEKLDHVDEALEIAQGAVRTCKRRFGDTDLLTLRAWTILADTLHTAFLNSASSSQLERAKDIATFVFEEYRKINGEYHEDTAEAETLLGLILRDKELYAEAELSL